MKTDLFQSCGHCWVFQLGWHIECSTFTASSFRIWNMSAGIPSPQLALFVVMGPKAHLTSHSRMSGSRWVLSDHTIMIIWVMKIFFVQVFCVFLPPLLNVFCFCWVHTISVLYCAHLCMKISLGISNFLEESPSLSHSTVFLYFFALIAEEGFLISCFLWNCAFKWIYLSFCPSICKAFLDKHFDFCISFSWGWSWSLPLVQCHKSPSIVLQAFCLLDIIPWIYFLLTLYNHKAFDLGQIWKV